MIEQLIEGNLVSIALPALEAWESHAWLFLGLGALSVVAAMVMFVSRIRPEEPTPAFGVLMLLSLALAAGLTWWSASSPRGGVVMTLFPTLSERFGAVDLAWQFPTTLGFALLGVSLIDVPGWAARRVHLGRLAMAAFIAVAGLGGRAASAAALEERDGLERVSALPCIQQHANVALELHAGRERTVALEEMAQVTSLGLRARPRILLLFDGGRFLEPAPGSPDDLAGLAEHTRYRAELSPEELEDWGIGTVVLRAPDEAGSFEVPLSFTHGPIRVSNALSAVSVSERGDPLFPLEANRTLVFARTRRIGARVTRTSVTELPSVSLRVSGDSVVDGFRTFVVEIDDPAATPTHQRLEVVPRDGHYVVRGDAPELVRASAPGALPEGEGAPCEVPFLPGTCACGPSGPTHCLSREPAVLGTLLWVGLATLTLGIAATRMGPPPEDVYVETRLVEVDGSPVAAPALVESAPRRSRRR